MSENSAPGALSALSAVNVPKLPGVRKPGHPAKGRTRHYNLYTDLDRISALILVAAVGVRDACEALGVPERTIRRWVADCGGIDGLSAEVGKALGVTRYAVALRVCQAIIERLPDFTPSELLDALRALSAGVARPDALEGDGPAAPTPAQVVVVVGNDRLPLAVEADNPQLSPEQETITVEASQPPAGGG